MKGSLEADQGDGHRGRITCIAGSLLHLLRMKYCQTDFHAYMLAELSTPASPNHFFNFCRLGSLRILHRSTVSALAMTAARL